MQITEALKQLYQKVTGEEEEATENQIADLIAKLAQDWPESSGGPSYTLPAATTSVLGGVKQAEAVAAVSAADASEAGDSYDKTAVQSLVTLSNGNKAAINAVIEKLKAAGIMT